MNMLPQFMTLAKVSLLQKTNTRYRQKSLPSVFPSLVVLEVPNNVSADLSHPFPQEGHRVRNTPGTGKLIKKEIRFYHQRSAAAQVECAAIISGLRFMLAKSANSCFLLFPITATSFIIPRQVRKLLCKIPTFQTWTAQIMPITASESSYCLSLQTAGNSSW